MNNDEQKQFELKIAFKNVKYLIEKKKSRLNPLQKTYIEWAENYFNDAVKSLDSMIKNNSKTYFETPFLLKTIGYFKKEPCKSAGDVKEVKSKFNSILESLAELKQDPKNFYKTENSRTIHDYIENILSYVPSKPSNDELDGDD